MQDAFQLRPPGILLILVPSPVRGCRSYNRREMIATTSREEALRQLRRAHHHEIRGALNALKLQLTLLQRGRQKTTPDDPRFGQWVDGAAAESDAVERALEELSAIERIDETVTDPDPLGIAQRVAHLLEPLARSRRAQLDCDLEQASERDSVPQKALPSHGGSGLARALLEAGAERLAAAEPGTTVSFRVGADAVEVLPELLRLPYGQLSESTP